MTTTSSHECAVPTTSLSYRVTATPRVLDEPIEIEVLDVHGVRRASSAIRSMMEFIDTFGDVEDYAYTIDPI